MQLSCAFPGRQFIKVLVVINIIKKERMERVISKHFQYTGLDDYDKSLDDQINDYLNEQKIRPEQIIDVEYAAHSSGGINTYSALIFFRIP
jgi:hypothetical protein